MLFRHITPISPEDATGPVADVYRQVDTEFSSIGPAVRMLSPAPELLAPCWALLRESLVAGAVPRWRKEIVTVSVSQRNDCAYDTAGHLVFLRLAGGEDAADALEHGKEPADEDLAALARWARSGGPQPFPAREAPEYLGTALALHFINRMVLVLLNEKLLPGAMRDDVPAAFDGAPIARAIHRERTNGDSLSLLDDVPSTGLPAWAGTSAVGPAYAALSRAAERGGGLLSEPAQSVVRETIARHRRSALDGDRGRLTDSLAALDPADRAGATLAVLAGVAPGRITETDVKTWRAGGYTDHCFVHLLAFGAIIAVQLVEGELTGE
ncbi:DNA-binding protein [Amycolatopsis sp. WAC 01375]|uniref:DNA-binding protein n=1 Tax=unclassified Amycolatopsis TaxID=2618356 RepID=UPI000F7B09D2|nr:MULTISPECIES: DNA-binding protein [unclassified Amycolatopsis]RSM72465.1 DNA-binding protein [Amycolatopsis sp. WAC 01375]RSN34452.1 DNA-binding protein [Amycolatopsis sp. WAC 01416]